MTAVTLTVNMTFSPFRLVELTNQYDVCGANSDQNETSLSSAQLSRTDFPPGQAKHPERASVSLAVEMTGPDYTTMRLTSSAVPPPPLQPHQMVFMLGSVCISQWGLAGRCHLVLTVLVQIIKLTGAQWIWFTGGCFQLNQNYPQCRQWAKQPNYW